MIAHVLGCLSLHVSGGTHNVPPGLQGLSLFWKAFDITSMPYILLVASLEPWQNSIPYRKDLTLIETSRVSFMILEGKLETKPNSLVKRDVSRIFTIHGFSSKFGPQSFLCSYGSIRFIFLQDNLEILGHMTAFSISKYLFWFIFSHWMTLVRIKGEKYNQKYYLMIIKIIPQNSFQFIDDCFKYLNCAKCGRRCLLGIVSRDRKIPGSRDPEIFSAGICPGKSRDIPNFKKI